MTAFDDRKTAAEAKFTHDQEFQFKTIARRNKLLGLWAAEQMGILGVHFALVSPTFGFRGCDDRRLGPCRGPARAAPPAGAVGRKAGHEPANGGD